MISEQAGDADGLQRNAEKINNAALIDKIVLVENSKPIDDIAQTDEIAQGNIVELEPHGYGTPFAFVTFASDDGIVGTLEAAGEAIIEGTDGTYSISPDLEYANLAQDAEFKKLVESVIRS